MALLPAHFLNTVVALGVPNPGGSVNYTATGFVYGHPVEEEDDRFAPFLVTNRHVVENLTSSGVSELCVRFNRPAGSEPKVYRVPLKNPDGSAHWTLHADPDCDVAVVSLVVKTLQSDGVQIAFVQGGEEGVVSTEQVRERQISEGEGVFVLGFPMGLSGRERNYPIVRQGIIARIQDWLENNSRTILIDASVFRAIAVVQYSLGRRLHR